MTKQESLVLSFFDPRVVELFEKKTVTDIFFNPDGKIFVTDKGREEYFGMNHGSLRNLINEIAHINDVVVNVHDPVLETSFLGKRITAVIPPMGAAPSLTIRKPNHQIIKLIEYVQNNSLSKKHYEYLVDKFVYNPKNIIIAGATGSGKTTFANALIDELVTKDKSNQRIVSIQDTPELVINVPNVLELFSTTKHSMQDCLKVTLRQTPKRIMVGEVRDKSVIAMLDAWNTGHHGGVATIHANSAKDVIQRIISLGSKEYDLHELYNLIGSTVGVIVSIQNHDGVRSVDQVLEIQGYDSKNNNLITKEI
ncbi:ATPase, T2SS/T4P/T4SS family [Francisella philomiragia]|uniref:ATPase, T2SS/T4P/T4SS family n=1 Tax=Francisella philomiragia TaxID=28110 RepID=UPI001905DF31|nr:ATPase, T2SS/T4P/T4SS family [Francisella philomiragia]MBK2270165.1 Flp pilus assembly complex ATPase component TadA [Francisella philomiragia]MBK2275829.1 Flp pilus assembly complex ATPase component TadA [Francisella philomiragia]MBK2305100.1 Flp pilus assembly complex ATPase component TadA [Francisella philomiragia]